MIYEYRNDISLDINILDEWKRLETEHSKYECSLEHLITNLNNPLANTISKDRMLTYLSFLDYEIEVLEGYAMSATNNKVKMSGCFCYPYQGYMGWHTNIDKPGTRVYFSYSEESYKNKFSYFDKEKNAIVDSYDLKGWNMRIFESTVENPLWHKVECKCPRIAIGFLVERE